MGEFLKGWRRKAGLVTLALACVLTAGWMRSYVVFDDQMSLDVPFGSPRIVWSIGGYVCSAPDGPRATPIESDLPSILDMQIRVGRPTMADVVIPYWSLVLPLTLLSAWLILGKPRKVKPAADLKLPARDESIQ